MAHKNGKYGNTNLIKIWVKGEWLWQNDMNVGDTDGGIAPGVSFEELPENWICPKCGVGKEYFHPVD